MTSVRPVGVYAAALCVLLLLWNDPLRAEAKPFGMTKRVIWKNLKIVGSPDPPLPYRAVRAYPGLEVKQPVTLMREPGRDSFLLLHHLRPWLGGEFPARLVRFRDNPGVSGTEVVLHLEDRMAYGLAFHPRYPENGYLYLTTNGRKQGTFTRWSRLSRFSVARSEPQAIDPESELVLLEWPSNGHNGGGLAFATDGTLFMSTGDGSNDSDSDLTGQDLSNLRGAVLRIDVDHPGADRAYSIPKDNPFLEIEDARPEIWAYGLRNPWRIAFDDESGQLWAGDVGQDRFETVQLVERGANYGWSVYEGSHPFRLQRQRGPTPISLPIVEHPHSEARSVTGGIVYRGKRFPELAGAFVYGDYETGRIWAVRHDGEKLLWHRELADTSLHITGFAADAEGEILFLDHGGAIYRLDPSLPKFGWRRFPTRLSETGLFRSAASHRVHPGLIPYSVIASQWTDGARKQRFVGLPGASRVGYRDQGGWDFPNGTVLMQTLSLDLEVGNPLSRHFVETRLLTRQDSEWVGYSYRWNDEQTDATLVPKSGATHRYRIVDANAQGGEREQEWVYPSRAECMTCHTRVANYALGLQTAQMNRVHDYGTVADNQLRTLQRIGFFRPGKDRAEAQRQARQRSSGHDELPSLVDPYDPSQDLTLRARSYLHANCSGCHMREGGGNSAMNLQFGTAEPEMRIFDQTPQHQSFGLEEARIVAPGRPDRSVMMYRVLQRTAVQMPPLASRSVDGEAAAMLWTWMSGLGDGHEKGRPPAPALD